MSLRPKLIAIRTEPSALVEEFTKFYCDLIPNLYNIQCPKFLDDVKCALKDIRRLKFDIDFRHGNQFYTDIKYEEPSVRCAYMYAYNVLNTIMIYREFLKHLNNKEQAIPDKLFGTKKVFKICCLAGGPATEAIAVSKAVSDFYSKSPRKCDLFTDVEVTVVDIVTEWGTEGEALINALNKSTNLLNSKRVQFHYTFLKADLVSDFNEILKEEIAEANIITIVKFASSIEEKSASVCVSYLDKMIMNVIDCMSANSCLFMLDVAGSRVFRQTMDVASKQQNGHGKVVSLHKKYRLLPQTLRKMEACINFRNVTGTGTLFPTVLTTISSYFWIKKKIKGGRKLVCKDRRYVKAKQPEDVYVNKKDNISNNDKNKKKGRNKKKPE